MTDLVFFRSSASIVRDGDKVRVSIPALSGLAKTSDFTIFVREYGSDELTKNYRNLLYQLGLEDLEDGAVVNEDISFALTYSSPKNGDRRYLRLVIPHAKGY